MSEFKPTRPWWAGSPEVEPFMAPVAEAISRHIERNDPAWTDIYNRAYEAVYAALIRRAQPENEPLTLEELRQMDGEPVYVVTLDNPLENQPYWAIAGINSNDSRYQNGVALYNRVQDDWGAFDLYGDTWLAYRAKPERGEG